MIARMETFYVLKMIAVRMEHFRVFSEYRKICNEMAYETEGCS
jgi:hypothetical protein